MGEGSRDSRQEAEARVAALEARLERLEERPGTPGPVFGRLLRYLPILALGNMLVAAPALLVSLAVAYFAFQQADATQKMQIATVWPNIAYDTGNLSDDGEPEISFNVANRGVGPARIRGMELSYEGRAFTDITSLLRACCVEPGQKIAVVMSSVNGEVLRPGDEVPFVRVAPDGLAPAAYRRFDEARLRVRARICYCSVFDDCWIEDSKSVAIEPVASCPVDWIQFGFPRDG